VRWTRYRGAGLWASLQRLKLFFPQLMRPASNQVRRTDDGRAAAGLACSAPLDRDSPIWPFCRARAEIERFMLGEDGANWRADRGGVADRTFIFRLGRSEPRCSRFALPIRLAGVLLSLTPQVVSSRRGLIIEGVATLRGNWHSLPQHAASTLRRRRHHRPFCWAPRAIARCAATRRSRRRFISAACRSCRRETQSPRDGRGELRGAGGPPMTSGPARGSLGRRKIVETASAWAVGMARIEAHRYSAALFGLGSVWVPSRRLCPSPRVGEIPAPVRAERRRGPGKPALRQSSHILIRCSTRRSTTRARHRL